MAYERIKYLKATFKRLSRVQSEIFNQCLQAGDVHVFLYLLTPVYKS